MLVFAIVLELILSHGFGEGILKKEIIAIGKNVNNNINCFIIFLLLYLFKTNRLYIKRKTEVITNILDIKVLLNKVFVPILSNNKGIIFLIFILFFTSINFIEVRSHNRLFNPRNHASLLFDRNH